MKALGRILMMLFAGIYLVVMLGFADRQYEGVLCNGVKIMVRDSLERGLVSASDISSLIRLGHGEVAGRPIGELDIRAMEESLRQYPAISWVEVYTNIQGKLMVEVQQRIPLARIEDRDHQHYYIDAGGHVVPAITDYTPHLLHINGYIPGEYRKAKNILTDAGRQEGGLMSGILELAAFIHSDPFWRSQIVQVYVNEKQEFELVPRVGSQIILFGDAEGLETKFFKLETLYREGLTHAGWNQYEIINLKYRNQVICTKR
jgi:cell division protein FtsQ